MSRSGSWFQQIDIKLIYDTIQKENYLFIVNFIWSRLNLEKIGTRTNKDSDPESCESCVWIS